MMGSEYMSKQEQEEKLASQKDILEAVQELSEEFKHTF